jgi:4-hydroxy-3-methylbut-2-enyl diphosphate reductase
MGEYHRKGFGLKETVKPMLEAAYASRVVDLLRMKGYQITRGGLTVRLAKEFGFCYGVERAVDMAYQTRHRYPDKRIFITNEIIHNQSVNKSLRDMGFLFLSGSYNHGETYNDITKDDVVILPAFGAPVKEIEILKEKNCILVDTTCGAVVKVWTSVEKYARDQYTSISHGKYNHEETIATSSRAGARYLVVRDLDEADYVCDYIIGNGNREQFLAKFAKAFSANFDPDKDLGLLGLANQTTMLSTESMEIGTRLRGAFMKKYGPDETKQRFRSFDTICSATQDRQDAVNAMMQTPPELMIVIGGYNSSNTTHLAEIGHHRNVPSYHIDDAACMISRAQIRNLPVGANTPNNKIGDTILRLFDLWGEDTSDLIAEIEQLGFVAAVPANTDGHEHDEH